MSKIVRANADVKAFASNATGTERTIFGEVTQSDLLTDQLSVDYLRGFGIVGASENPTREDFNALGYTSMQFIAYLHQMGVAEWNALQQYQIGSQANRDGVLYACKTLDHISATVPESDATNWRQVNLGVSGAGGDLTQTLAQTQAILDNAALKTNNGLAGNYETILSLGAYSSGAYSYPNSHTESNYSSIVVIAIPISSTTTAGLSGTATKEFIAANSASWGVVLEGGSSTAAIVEATTSTTFTVSQVGDDNISQIIGYLKEGVS